MSKSYPRNLSAICSYHLSVALLLYASLFSALPAKEAEPEMSNGELASIIRSADQPCNHVIEFQKTAKDTWLVTCNSGVFSVKGDGNRNYSVSPSD